MLLCVSCCPCDLNSNKLLDGWMDEKFGSVNISESNISLYFVPVHLHADCKLACTRLTKRFSAACIKSIDAHNLQKNYTHKKNKHASAS